MSQKINHETCRHFGVYDNDVTQLPCKRCLRDSSYEDEYPEWEYQDCLSCRWILFGTTEPCTSCRKEDKDGEAILTNWEA